MSTTTGSQPLPSSESLLDTLFSYDNTIMLAAIISLLLVILFVLFLHLYARWFLSNHHNSRHRHRLSPHQVSAVTIHELSPGGVKDTAADGLDAEAIDSIPIFSYEAEAEAAAAIECSVCLSEFDEGEAGRRLPRCSHSFHIQCIDTWLRAYITCPVCRLDVVLNEAKEDEDCKGDGVVLDIIVDESAEESPSPSSSSESARFERLMRMTMSRRCRSDDFRINHRSEGHRPSM